MNMRLTLLIVWLFSIQCLQAQTPKGTITGKIIDENGIAMPYVTLFLDGTPWGTVTNEQGIYLLKVPVGTYKVIGKFLGYTDYAADVSIAEDRIATLDIKMTENLGELGEIVVSGVKVKSATATRILMEIQDIPQSIVVLGQKTIEQQAAFDLTTITRNMSGINFTGNYSGAGSYQFFNARGFDLVNSQNFRWNGMMIWNLGNNYADNIEQVEFLKGPSSILFGDVAPGGVMNFSTKKPLADFYLKTELRLGEWNLFRPAMDVSGPITKSKNVRYRLNTSYEKSNSFRDFVTSERFMIAPALTWDITPKLSFNTEAVIKRSSATDDAGLVSPDGTVEGLDQLAPSLYLGEPSMKYEYEDNNYFANLTYQISQNWRIRAVGFYGYTENKPLGLWFDPPNTDGDFVRNQYGYHQWLKNNSLSADASGTFYTGSVKHNILIGSEYQSTHFRYTNEGYLSEFGVNNINNPVYGVTPVVEPGKEMYLPFISRIRRYGIYFQDQVMLMQEKLHVLIGFRYGNTQQGNDYLENELQGTDYEGYTDDLVDGNVLSPRIGLVYKPMTWASIYGSYSQGYEINSPDLFALNYAEFSTPPATTSSQFEFGTKANLFKEKLGLTLSLFQIDKKDPYGFVYLDPINPNFDEYNVYYDGHHRSQGIEIDMDGKIIPQLSLTMGAAYTRTKVVEDPGYPSGNQLPNAPKFTGNVWLNYEPTDKLKGFSAGFGAFFKDKFFSGINNDRDLEIPASYTMDVALGYKYKQFGVQLNVSNLTNQVNYSNPWIFNLFEVRPLRRAVVTLTYKLDKKSKR